MWCDKVSTCEELAASIRVGSDIPANQMEWLRPDCALFMGLQGEIKRQDVRRCSKLFIT
jgi:hypothetical protein